LSGVLFGPQEREQDAAWRRAESLLRDSLTLEQFEQYSDRGYLEVRSHIDPHRVYRVDGWRPVAVYERGAFVGAVCIRPKEHIPGPDILLARKLMIEGAEREFLSAGNWLQPAWRPAGVAPTLFLILALISPWLLSLRTFGVVWVFVAALLLSSPLTFAWWRRRGAG
jgi:hypothetical protein